MGTTTAITTSTTTTTITTTTTATMTNSPTTTTSGQVPTSGQVSMTCGDVKRAYRAAACCGNPGKVIEFSSARRLATTDEEGLLARIKKTLTDTKKRGGAEEARRLWKSLREASEAY